MTKDDDQLTEEQQNCTYCHFPFNAILDASSKGYSERFWGMEDKTSVYFAFREERPDGNYSAVTINFKYCPMCGRKLIDSVNNKNIEWTIEGFETHNYNIGLSDD